MARAHFSTADLERAHKAASKVGRVASWEIKPDNDDFWDGSPLLEDRP